MFTKKITFAACAAALSATVLASNAHAMECSEMTGNQLLAAIERGQCEVQAVGSTHTIVENDRWINISRNAASLSGNAGSRGYGY